MPMVFGRRCSTITYSIQYNWEGGGFYILFAMLCTQKVFHQCFCASSWLYRRQGQEKHLVVAVNVRDNGTLGCGLSELNALPHKHTQICTNAHTNTLTGPQIDLAPFANYLYIFTLLLTQAAF